MSSSHASSGSQSSQALQPIALPSGLVMSNGLVKAAMYEHMASLFGGLPNANHLALYTLWSQGGWGMVVTGNVQVSRDHLSLGRDMVIPQTVTADTLRSYKALASAMRPASEQFRSKSQDASTPRTLIIMQLSHSGRQSPIVLGGRLPLVSPLAPSALGLGRSERLSSHMGWFARLMYKIGFPTPRVMTLQDIDHTVDRFVLGAKLAHDSGFDGVELHASHGYLLAQFISRKSNIRDDAYSAKHAPLHLLQRVVTSIRKVLPRTFVLGIKLSSSDYVGAGSLHEAQAEQEAEDRALSHVVDIARWDMIDFIEISGGDYENPEFMATDRQAFFARFARKARSAIHTATSSPKHPLVLLTGGMGSPATVEDALSQGHADLIGIGRGSVLVPKLPLLLNKAYSHRETGTSNGEDNDDTGRTVFFQQPTLSYSDTPLVRAAASILRSLGILPLPALIGAGTGTAWYVVMMSRISRGSPIDYQMRGIRAVLSMWLPEPRALPILFSFCVACYGFVYLWSHVRK
ncbi:hypothetical protein BJV78DRAFT_1392551 [Lactifluus subvellereus]|nr:hypothetical protein BJV78DRAFT_1392551 [Lactifluus subvellereus]